MLFIIFHVMPRVQMHIDNAEGLVTAYGAASNNARETMVALSPLVTRAYDLLGMAGQNGLTGPMPALMNLANDLRAEGDDVAWRVDWLKTTDALPLGLSGRVTGEVPADLDAAFRASGLTPEQIELANQMMRDGMSFTDAIAAAQSDDPQAALDAWRQEQYAASIDQLYAQLEATTNRVGNLDYIELQRELEAEVLELAGGNPQLAAYIMAGLNQGLTAEEALNAAQGRVQQDALEDQLRIQGATTVIVDVNEHRTYIFGLPEDEFWEAMANNGYDLDAVLASIELDESLGLLRWEADSVLMTPEDTQEMLALREQLGLNENETLFIARDGTKYVRVNPGPNEVFVPVSEWATRRFLGEDPSVTVFGSDDNVRYQPLDEDYWLVSIGNEPPILVPVSAIPDHIISDHFGDEETTARRQAEFEESLGGTLVNVSDALLDYTTSPRGIAELATSIPGIDTFGDIGWCAFDGTRWVFTDGNGVDTGLSCAAVVIPGVSRTVISAVSEGGEAAVRAADDIAEAADDVPDPNVGSGSPPPTTIAPPSNVGPASNAANGPRLSDDLTRREAASAFDDAGNLKPEILNTSRIITPGDQLGNPAVIDALTADGSDINDWAKWSTQTIPSPNGDFQVHFYRNVVTGRVNTDIDYKVKFN